MLVFNEPQIAKFIKKLKDNFYVFASRPENKLVKRLNESFADVIKEHSFIISFKNVWKNFKTFYLNQVNA